MELLPEHSNYWHDIGSIAEVIAFMLEAQQSGWKADAFQYSTIAVQQFKEKFGECRVYVQIADRRKVDTAYNRLKEAIQEARTKQEENVYPKSRPIRELPTLEEYTKECILKDYTWYRYCYRTIISLMPQYEDVIIGGSDYEEFLYKDKEEYETHLTQRRQTTWYRPEDEEELQKERTLVYEVCCWKSDEKETQNIQETESDCKTTD